MSRGGLLYILSNNHVLARSSFGLAGEAINQPGASACFASTSLVGNLQLQSTIIPTLTSNGIAPSNVDAALAQVSPGAVDAAGTILELGAAGPSSIADAPPSATLAAGRAGTQRRQEWQDHRSYMFHHQQHQHFRERGL